MALEESEDKKSVEETGGEERISIPKSEFELLLKKVDSLTKDEKTLPQGQSGVVDMNAIGAMIQGMMSNQTKSSAFKPNGQFDFNQGSDVEVPEDDYLDEKDWKVFVAFRVGHFISDDKRKGRPVRAPFGVIEFKYSFTQRDQNGREQNLVNVSQYICKSKIVKEFLESHTQYGVSFFDRVDMTLAKANSSVNLVRKMEFLKKQGAHELRMMAKGHEGVIFTEDLDSVRIQLAQSMVKEDEKMGRKRTEDSLTDTFLADQALAVGK
tara:strand:- start:6549 stop:7346 length:798 start_codon:yes stop_codon:yes gene_type:complete